MMALRNTRSTRAFDRLLSLYPRDFRDEYGREMSLLFADRYTHAANARERAQVWFDSLYGLACEIPKEHLRMILHDLRYAIRTLAHQPLFSITIIATLALGIGANSAIFSVINALALRALPLAHPGELYSVRVEAARPLPQRFSWPMFQRLSASLPPGTAAAMGTVARLHARPSPAAPLEPAEVQPVSGEYFDVLKVPVVLGRALNPSDNLRPGAHPVTVISYRYWQKKFNGTADVLQRPLRLAGVQFTIVGVAAEGFSGVWLESPADAWIPLAMQHDIRYSQNYSASNSDPSRAWMPQENISWLSFVVRTADSKATEVALTQAFRVGALAATEKMGDSPERALLLQTRLVLQPFGTGFSRLRERFLNPLYLLMGMAALVLLIACANTANLLLARAVGREREIAMRLSLGAGRLRLVQQLLTESLLLVAASGIAALLLAGWAAPLLVRMATTSPGTPAAFEVQPDSKVLAFTMAISLFTTLLFGLAPAIRAIRVDLAGALKAGSRNVLGGAGSKYARLLVVAQVAFSLTLVSATGLLIRSFQNLAKLDLGFDQEHVLTAEIGVKFTSGDPQELHRRILDRIRALPSVQSASVAMCSVLRGCRSLNDGYAVEGYQPGPQEEIAFLVNFVDLDYFETMGMRIVEGRAFDRSDTPKSTPVVVVNEALARRYFPALRATGKRLGQDNKLSSEIVGVARDARVLNPREAPMPMVYYSITQTPRFAASALEIRTRDQASLSTETVRRTLSETAPEMPVGHITPMADQVNAMLNLDRLLLWLSSTFGGLALGLAGFGLFGTLSFAVARRTSEFGIRIALGATSSSVLWSVCREAFVMVAAGSTLALPAVLLGSRTIQVLLFGVSPQDWTVYAAAACALLAVAALAAFLPAWRASQVDPLTALRME